MITSDDIIKIASVLTASIFIISLVVSVLKWYLKQQKQDEEITCIKKEQAVICYGLLACLDGLKQLGANGNVTEAHNELEKHINQSAHKS